MTSIEARLGHKIARHRKHLGLTQAQLAEKIEVQPETISRLETGRHKASLSLIAKVAAAFDLRLHELLHLQVDSEKERALEHLLLFAGRLSATEVELVVSVGAAVIDHARRTSQT